MNSPTTEQLIQNVLAGDRPAFDVLSEKYRAPLRSFVDGRLGQHLRDRVGIDDILQESFLKAFESLERFEWRGDDSFFGWLCGIARNAIYRQSRRYVKISKAEPIETAPLDGTSPSRHMRREERFDRLEKALEGLSDEHRQVITLSRIDGLPMREVAARMNRSTKAAYQLLWRALKRLKESFGDTASLGLPDRKLGGEA